MTGHDDVSHTWGWRHCDDTTTRAGVDCARAPRQSCAHGTHDHLVRLADYRAALDKIHGQTPMKCTNDIERTATCPRHGRVVIELERLTRPPESWGWHRKPDGRWCRLKVRSWVASRSGGSGRAEPASPVHPHQVSVDRPSAAN